MNDLRKAAEMALDVLRNTVGHSNQSQTRIDDAKHALVQALAQPKQEFVGACVTCGAPKSEWLVDAVNMSQECVDETEKSEHEPVAWMWKDGSLTSDPYEADGTWTKLYIAPPKRQWVGLTDDDIHDAFNYVEMVKLLDFDRDRPEWCEAFARACEARLRHRNGEKQ